MRSTSPLGFIILTSLAPTKLFAFNPPASQCLDPATLTVLQSRTHSSVAGLLSLHPGSLLPDSKPKMTVAVLDLGSLRYLRGPGSMMWGGARASRFGFGLQAGGMVGARLGRVWFQGLGLRGGAMEREMRLDQVPHGLKIPPKSSRTKIISPGPTQMPVEPLISIQTPAHVLSMSSSSSSGPPESSYHQSQEPDEWGFDAKNPWEFSKDEARNAALDVKRELRRVKAALAASELEPSSTSSQNTQTSIPPFSDTDPPPTTAQTAAKPEEVQAAPKGSEPAIPSPHSFGAAAPAGGDDDPGDEADDPIPAPAKTKRRPKKARGTAPDNSAQSQPPKAETNPAVQTDTLSSPPPKKRGRPKRIGAASSETDVKGHAPKGSATSAAVVDSDNARGNAPDSSAQSQPLKAETNPAIQTDSVSLPPPKKRGRPKKRGATSSESDLEGHAPKGSATSAAVVDSDKPSAQEDSSDLSTTKRKGRPKRIASPTSGNSSASQPAKVKQRKTKKAAASEQEAVSEAGESAELDSGFGSSSASRRGQSQAQAAEESLLQGYDPSEQASWTEGEPVPFSELARCLDAISTTTKRLEIGAVLTNSMRSVLRLTPADLLPFVYITLSRVAPSHEGQEMGVGDSLLVTAIAAATGAGTKKVKEKYKEQGDLGRVVVDLRKQQQTLNQPKPLTVSGVFEAMKNVAGMQGKDTVKRRQEAITSLLVAATRSEGLWIVRAFQGKLRVGLAESTVISSLATAIVLEPPPETMMLTPPDEKIKEATTKAGELLKQTLAEMPSYDVVIPVLLKYPYTDLPKHCRMTPGVPLKPMLAHPSRGQDEVWERFGNQTVTAEYKYDGERAQVHLLENGSVRVFSRNSEDTTGKFPDLCELLPKVKGLATSSAVIDCEVVAFDRENNKILPFQVLSTRARKNVKSEDVKVNVCVFAFDMMFRNGEPIIDKSLQERRQILQSSFIELPGQFQYVTGIDTGVPAELDTFFQEAVGDGTEGIMVKSLEGQGAAYVPDKRSRQWLKLKKDYVQGLGDTFDLVVVGAWQGKGKRSGGLGAFLLATWNPERGRFETVTKLGSGFTDAQLVEFNTALTALSRDSPAPDLDTPLGADSLQPDVWIEPRQVWEIAAADISLSPVHRSGAYDMAAVENTSGFETAPPKGLALRFPRFIRIRTDKEPQEATTAAQVMDVYQQQVQGSNT